MNMQPDSLKSPNDESGSYEEPEISAPAFKKKKGITINEMLQNDLESDEEKLERHRKA